MTARKLEEEAALWLIRREGGDWSDADEGALQVWLSKETAHQAAFWRLEKGWGEADRLSALGDITSAPGKKRQRPVRFGIRPYARRLIPIAIAASLAASVLVAVGLHLQGSGASSTALQFETPRGGSETVRLADGSRIELNTATVLRATTGQRSREVWLDEGEAFFDVAHKPDQPFVVHAGPRRITVLGTRFSVRRKGEMVTVAVLSGQVRLDRAGDTQKSHHSTLVSQGDVAVSRKGDILVSYATPDRVNAALAWREGMVVFSRTPLSNAVAEFNRYGSKPIRIDDPRLADIRVGGAFRTTNSAAFLRLMQDAYGVDVRETEDAIVLTD